ncbi:DNA-binding transcriptional regulator, LysR family [Streptoalloteichus tenebrarius]|uniref:DNA-binding transcriptional regulator, LysR family n=1 Tax=Streptoalloteichus tenebrarius (strain ATCC 17920 / DSM 40477 / JCM 4838 / CBS 697.72 / NBRC 16177 / NCIMB 11028 / NRRL B-12390 / A12253. 1 / ISP 5477) TaxID=1933 RepID=A0ABT1HZN3_STRSD|nr:LysR family transcriptional regulator [Streptoalloteichus tenebrarius]MCP2260980.1 DNA-binding transcriptional regulator, LysR family [Streptoalloteichus tenebrarius]BFE98918.1 LysR family transcriptional regulator [Streptoalloteichus tenebrarius]
MDKRRGRQAELELKHLRYLVAIVDAGSFTDAAVDLGVSQAAVSRTLLALERVLGVRLLHRTSRTVSPTSAGAQVIARARMLLHGADELVREVSTGHTRLRIGHAWSAMGRHTAEFQRRWHERHPEVELHLVRHNSPTAGLAEGLCDLAVIRASLDLRRWSHAVVGHEPRYVALAADDPWARRRAVRLAEISSRTLVVDRRTGTTTLDLWPEDVRPAVEHIHDVDDWLAAIATGRCVGVTPQATATQYRRDGIVYRPLRDAAPVPVRLIWRRHDPHPATHEVVALLTDLYREQS